MANPFLFDADYGGGVGADTATAAAPVSVNPFLSDFGGDVSTSTVPDFGAAAAPAEVNPFLSYQPAAEATYTTMAHDPMMMTTSGVGEGSGGGATNPFASFFDAPMDMTPAPPVVSAQSTGAAVFGTAIDHGAALFGGVDTAPMVAVDTLFDMQEEPTRPTAASVPSSTQDLLETVTGALEATSDSLLDRLRATQPSPVPQMIQPSPSPRSPSPDLLGADPPPPPPPSANPLAPSPGFNQVDNIMDLFDTPKSSGPKSSLEILGLYNSTTNTTASAAVAPSKPEPLLDLLDSFPAPSEPTTSSEDMATIQMAEQPQPILPAVLDLGSGPITATAPLVAEELSVVPPQPVIEETPAAAPEPAKPQPMRPPPPPPSPKAAPPERPKPPPPVQQPAAPAVPLVTVPPVTVPPQSEVTVVEHPPSPSPVVLPEQRSPLPSRPPPPVPPAPRVSPQPQQMTAAEPPHQIKSPSPPASGRTTPSPTRPAPAAVPPSASPFAPPAPPVVSAFDTPAPSVVSAFDTPTPAVVSAFDTPTPAVVSAFDTPAPAVVSAFDTPAPAVVSAFDTPAPPAASAFDISAPAAASPFTTSSIFEPAAASTVTSNSITNSTASALFGTSSTPFGASAIEFSTTGGRDAFSSGAPPAAAPPAKPVPPAFAAATAGMGDSFDAFDAKFSQAGSTAPASAFGDAFGGGGVGTAVDAVVDSAWGNSGGGFDAPDTNSGFGNEVGFDNFLALTEPPPVPQSTPAKRSQAGDDDDDFDQDEKEMSVVIRPKADFSLTLAPALAPPPKSPAAMSTGSAFSDENTAYVPFLSSAKDSKSGTKEAPSGTTTTIHKSDSQDSPQTPLFEEDQSQPLEDFPRITYTGEGWEMFMRLPNKKKITGQRFWKKVFVKVGSLNDVPVVQMYTNKGDKDPFQEIPLQACYSVSEISAQQFDQYGKVFTIKLQYIFYKERPGVRPGQLSKASRISDKLTQFAAYAIQGDYAGVKEFGSDLKKLGAPIEHSPQISQLVKLGVATYEDIRQFSIWIEENLFRMLVHRDRAINYKTEEIQVTIVDEYHVEQDIYGVVTRQIARVRLFFLSFLNGVAEVEMGVNDLRRQGKEIVGRHDIIPVPTEEWIRMEAIEFSNCVQLDEFDNTQTIKFKPPDACYIELMRFRVRPPKHRELPMQVKTVFTTLGQRIEIRSDILVPGFTSRKLGQIPCEDVMVRFPIPEEWIYMFRVEKHFRYGSVKSAHRRSGKVKGIERFLGAVEAVEQSLMETTSGQAKYEHHHKAIVWRIPRLPKEGQGAYTTHSFFCHITLQSHERIPENLGKHCYVEFTMPHTTVSHTVCRSISVPSCDDPPEKCCRYLSRHEYIVEIEHAQGVTPGTYTVAAAVKKEEPPPPVEEEKPMPGKAESDSDFSDDD